MNIDTFTVGELIKELQEYSSDVKVYYSTKYALTPFTLHYSKDGDCLILEMSKEYIELLGNER